MSMLDFIAEIRGGIPEKCDFCGKMFTQACFPIPEEGGEWACSECWSKWEEEDNERTNS
jgi:hypothetical protein